MAVLVKAPMMIDTLLPTRNVSPFSIMIFEESINKEVQNETAKKLFVFSIVAADNCFASHQHPIVE
jgi:hypothetical protein